MFKSAVIGGGWAGRVHAAGYKAIEECELVAVADLSRFLAEKISEKFGGRVYESATSLLDDEKPDIVSVCTPPAMHRPIIEAIIERGIKYIVCEKPLAHNTVDARAIAEAVERASALLMTAFCHRFIEPVQKIKQMVSSGELGEPVFFRNQFASMADGMEKRWFSNLAVSGGGALIDTSVHSIDLFRFLCGEVKNVNARVSNHIPSLPVEDTASMFVESESGCFGILEASWGVKVPRAVLEFCGTKGRAIYEYWKEFRVRREGEGEWTTVPVRRDINLRFEDELRHFVRAIKGEEKLSPDVKDGLRANEIVEAAYRSIAQKKWIPL